MNLEIKKLKSVIRHMTQFVQVNPAPVLPRWSACIYTISHHLVCWKGSFKEKYILISFNSEITGHSSSIINKETFFLLCGYFSFHSTVIFCFSWLYEHTLFIVIGNSPLKVPIHILMSIYYSCRKLYCSFKISDKRPCYTT